MWLPLIRPSATFSPWEKDENLKTTDGGFAGGGEHQFGDGPDEGVEAVGAAIAGKTLDAVAEHLRFEQRVFAGVNDAAFGIERGDGLGACPFAARGEDFLDRHIGIDLLQHGDDKVAALVDFCDDAIGVVVAIGSDRGTRPIVRDAAFDRAIGDDVGAAIRPEPRNDDAAGVRIGVGRDGWVERDDDAAELGRFGDARVIDPGAAPERAKRFLDEFALELLASEQATAKAAFNRLNKRRRKICCVVTRLGPRDNGCGIGKKRFEGFGIARRGGDDGLRLGAETERELEIVPGGLRAAPFAEFVAPGGVELGTAQAVGIVGGKELCDGAIAPFELVSRNIEVRPICWSMDR